MYYCYVLENILLGVGVFTWRSKKMSSTDIVLLSASAALGAILATAALRYISSTSRKHSSSPIFASEMTNGNSGAGASSPDTRNPFDPSKRKSYGFLLLFFFFLFVWSLIVRYLSWDDYFMAIAFLSAERSKDPNRQVTFWFPNLYFWTGINTWTLEITTEIKKFNDQFSLQLCRLELAWLVNLG